MMKQRRGITRIEYILRTQYSYLKSVGGKQICHVIMGPKFTLISATLQMNHHRTCLSAKSYMKAFKQARGHNQQDNAFYFMCPDSFFYAILTYVVRENVFSYNIYLLVLLVKMSRAKFSLFQILSSKEIPIFIG